MPEQDEGQQYGRGLVEVRPLKQKRGAQAEAVAGAHAEQHEHLRVEYTVVQGPDRGNEERPAQQITAPAPSSSSQRSRSIPSGGAISPIGDHANNGIPKISATRKRRRMSRAAACRSSLKPANPSKITARRPTRFDPRPQSGANRNSIYTPVSKPVCQATASFAAVPRSASARKAVPAAPYRRPLPRRTPPRAVGRGRLANYCWRTMPCACGVLVDAAPRLCALPCTACGSPISGWPLRLQRTTAN